MRDNLFTFSGEGRWIPGADWGLGAASAVVVLSGAADLELGDSFPALHAGQSLVFADAAAATLSFRGEGIVCCNRELDALGVLQEVPLMLDRLSQELIRTVLMVEERSPDHQEAAIRLLCYQLVEAEPAEAAKERGTDVEEMIAWLEEHMDEPLTLDTLTARFGCSRSTLLNRFRRDIGQSPMRLLASRRLERARVALEQTDRSVTDIARSVGYPEPSSFTRFIKSRTGHGPTELRRRARWVV